MNNEIVIYQSNELTERIEVRLKNETVWLNRQQLALLFGRDIKTIGSILIMFLMKENWLKNWLSQNLRQPLSTVP